MHADLETSQPCTPLYLFDTRVVHRSNGIAVFWVAKVLPNAIWKRLIHLLNTSLYLYYAATEEPAAAFLHCHLKKFHYSYPKDWVPLVSRLVKPQIYGISLTKMDRALS